MFPSPLSPEPAVAWSVWLTAGSVSPCRSEPSRVMLESIGDGGQRLLVRCVDFATVSALVRLATALRRNRGGGVQLPPPFPLQELPTMTTPSEAVEIYCLKSKAKTASQDIEAVVMKNGRPATPLHLRGVRHQEVPHRRSPLTTPLPVSCCPRWTAWPGIFTPAASAWTTPSTGRSPYPPTRPAACASCSATRATPTATSSAPHAIPSLETCDGVAGFDDRELFEGLPGTGPPLNPPPVQPPGGPLRPGSWPSARSGATSTTSTAAPRSPASRRPTDWPRTLNYWRSANPMLVK